MLHQCYDMGDECQPLRESLCYLCCRKVSAESPVSSRHSNFLFSIQTRMQNVKVVTALSLLLIGLCGCEESIIERKDMTARTEGIVPNQPSNGIEGYIPNPGGQSLPYPTITKKTFIPEYSLWAHTKCLTWRIEWPNYPAGTDSNKIPTVFTLSNGALNSFDFLNGQPASTTYKTNFNLYHNAQLEMSRTLWSELVHAFGAGNQMDAVWFNQVDVSLKTLEHMVKERPVCSKPTGSTITSSRRCTNRAMSFSLR